MKVQLNLEFNSLTLKAVFTTQHYTTATLQMSLQINESLKIQAVLLLYNGGEALKRLFSRIFELLVPLSYLKKYSILTTVHLLARLKCF